MNPEIERQISELTANFNAPKIEGIGPLQIWPLIHLMEPFVEAGLLTPVTPLEIHNNLGNFIVVKPNSHSNEIFGCGQLAVYRKDLAEIRSVCVREDKQRQGIGKIIVDELTAMAQKKNISNLLIISKTPAFWEKQGFYGSDGPKAVRIKAI